jgi:hypothetical protein
VLLLLLLLLMAVQHLMAGRSRLLHSPILSDKPASKTRNQGNGRQAQQRQP